MRLISRAAPIRFHVATSLQEVEAVHRLRNDIVEELGWHETADLPGGQGEDRYDHRAQHVVAWDGDTLAGTVRLVRPESGQLLPVEEAYRLIVEPRGEVVGAGQLIVDHAFRDGSHVVLGGLAAKTWLLMREWGFQWAAGTATSEMLGLFGHLGFEVDILGDPHKYWGEMRYPIRMGAANPEAWQSGETDDDRQ